uniref:Uncharacterized protein n=1 Tax=Meleagris gallopavo TaxID=9103 RepID=A0A803Y6D8_MELGA
MILPALREDNLMRVDLHKNVPQPGDGGAASVLILGLHVEVGQLGAWPALPGEEVGAGTLEVKEEAIEGVVVHNVTQSVTQVLGFASVTCRESWGLCSCSGESTSTPALCLCATVLVSFALFPVITPFRWLCPSKSASVIRGLETIHFQSKRTHGT